MEVFVKEFSTYRTIKQASALSSNLVLDSLSAETSTISVRGTAIDRSDAGNWIIIDGKVYLISSVNPAAGKTSLSLLSPLDAFSRRVEAPAGAYDTVGAFIQATMDLHWLRCQDPVYAMPYLSIQSLDTNPVVSPSLDTNGCFDLAEYCRLMRQTYRTTVIFEGAGNSLNCIIQTAPSAQRQISFSDGRSQLQRVDYAAAGIAKLTVYQDNGSGGKTKTDWYLSESGEVSQEIPGRRAPGRWETLTLGSEDLLQARVTEAFAASRADHKVEFYSTVDLAVHDFCTFNIYGVLLQSEISYKSKSSTDRRFHYKAGQLKTTAAEKLKGVIK